MILFHLYSTVRLIFLHWAISTFITSIAFDTYTIGFIIGGLIALGSYLAYKLYQGTQYYRVVIAIALLSFSALFIQQYYGRIEFHFHIFIALAFLTIYRDRLPLAVASIFIIIHQLSPGHYFTFKYEEGFPRIFPGSASSD